VLQRTSSVAVDRSLRNHCVEQIGILGKSARGLVICYWDAKPLKLAGPIWVEAPDADRDYLDKYFTGWVIPPNSNCWTVQHSPNCSSPMLTMRTRLVVPEH
jgi:hypothetical protein